jgi:hypothetical protein
VSDTQTDPQAAAGGWRSRITGHGEEAPDSLLASPFNWRIHPRVQHEALATCSTRSGGCRTSSSSSAPATSSTATSAQRRAVHGAIRSRSATSRAVNNGSNSPLAGLIAAGCHIGSPFAFAGDQTARHALRAAVRALSQPPRRPRVRRQL